MLDAQAVDASPLQSVKLAVIALTGLSRDALHVHAGLAAYVLAAVVLRKHPGFPWPWLIAAAVACGMEAMDAVDGIVSYGHWRVRASVHDVANTLWWPTVFALASRYARPWAARGAVRE